MVRNIAELSGFTGTETRGQPDFCFIISWGWPAVLAGTLAMLNTMKLATLGKINVPSLVIVGASDSHCSRSQHNVKPVHSELVTLKPGVGMGLMEQNQLASCQRLTVLPAPNSTRHSQS